MHKYRIKWLQNFEIEKQPNMNESKKIELVECARGAAAVYVCFGHVVGISGIRESFMWAKYLCYPFGFGSEAVYLFFFLSGFSIHYSSINRQLNTIGGISYYYFLRFRRIYPVFLISIIISIFFCFLLPFLNISSKTAVIPNFSDLFLILSFFTDIHIGAFSPGLLNNPALWSLSYEIPYYLVYPIFWNFCKINGVVNSFIFSIILSIVLMLIGGIYPNHFSNVFSLYWLWTCGCLMAEWRLHGRKFSISQVVLYSILFLSYAVGQSFEAVAHHIMVKSLKALTIGLVIFSVFVEYNKASLIDRIFAICLIGCMLISSLILTVNFPTLGRHVFLDIRLILASCLLIVLIASDISIAYICRMAVKPFLKAGQLSYSMYVIHLPIMYFAVDVLNYKKLPCYYLIVTLIPVFYISWFIEMTVQVKVSLWIDKIRINLLNFFES